VCYALAVSKVIPVLLYFSIYFCEPVVCQFLTLNHHLLTCLLNFDWVKGSMPTD